MNPERDLLRLLAAMPFLDRLEMAAVSGWRAWAPTGPHRRLLDLEGPLGRAWLAPRRSAPLPVRLPASH